MISASNTPLLDMSPKNFASSSATFLPCSRFCRGMGKIFLLPHLIGRNSLSFQTRSKLKSAKISSRPLHASRENLPQKSLGMNEVQIALDGRQLLKPFRHWNSSESHPQHLNKNLRTEGISPLQQRSNRRSGRHSSPLLETTLRFGLFLESLKSTASLTNGTCFAFVRWSCASEPGATVKTSIGVKTGFSQKLTSLAEPRK